MSVDKGFTITLGVIMAFAFVFVVLPVVGSMVLCGGCTMLGLSGVAATAVAIEEALEAEKRRVAEEAQEELAAEPGVERSIDTIPASDIAASPADIAASPQALETDPHNVAPITEPDTESNTAAPSAGPHPNEKEAARKLELAKSLLRLGKPAKSFLHEVIDKYPNTEAAKEAAELLK